MSILSWIGDEVDQLRGGGLGGLLGARPQPINSMLQTPQVQSQDLPPLTPGQEMGMPVAPAPAPPPPSQGFADTLNSNPGLANALFRLSGGLAQAASSGGGTLAGIGYGLSQFGQGLNEYKQQQIANAKTQAETHLTNAQTGLTGVQAQVAKLKQGLPFQGDSVEASIGNKRYAYYKAQGDDDQTAIAKAYNEVGIKPQVTPGGAVVQPAALPLPGQAYQGGGAPAPSPIGVGGQGALLPPPAAAADIQAPQGAPQLNGVQQASGNMKFADTTGEEKAKQIQDQLTSAQKDVANYRQALGALTNAKSLVSHTFDTTLGSPDLKADVSSFLGLNQDKVAATKAYSSQINTALGPVLRMQDSGPNGQFRMLQGEITNGQKTLGDVDSSHESKLAIIQPNIDRLQTGMALASYKANAAQQGILVTPDMEKQFLASIGADNETMLPQGKTSASYLPSAQAPAAPTNNLQSAVAAEIARRAALRR